MTLRPPTSVRRIDPLIRCLVGGAILLACGAPESTEVTGCHLDLDPSAELAEATARAGARLEAASGCSVSIGAGIPVMLEPVVKIDGAPMCAITPTVYDSRTHEAVRIKSIRISEERPEGCVASYEDTIAHEMLHALGLLDSMHTSSGVFGASSDNMVFNEESLTMLCTHVPCSRFEVEPDRPPTL